MLQLVSDEMGDLNSFIYRRNNGALFRSSFNVNYSIVLMK
jgi:hypothetical protein